MHIYLLDGKDMISRKEAFRVIGATMAFPDWFGGNLDALADCLGELSKDVAIVFCNTAILEENLGDYAGKILRCFTDLSSEVGFTFIQKR